MSDAFMCYRCIKMKGFLVLCVLLATALALPKPFEQREADTCNQDECFLPDCRCSSVNIPGGIPREQTPQFVMLTFDDAVNVINIEDYRAALYDRYNANGCPVSATFFVSHEYTDYSKVHELHSRGHEIALHSITHTTVTDYWKDASVEKLTREFADQKQMMDAFAKVPQNDVRGIRMPFLQMAGNNQFEMLNNNGFLYDLSWTSRQFMDPPLWPYTTKYKTTQDCLIGPCPDESYPNVWVVPMTHWNNDNQNHTCSMADACVSYNDQEYQLDWLKREFRRHYDGNRAPFGFFIHAAWFQADRRRFDVYVEFLNYLDTLSDVFLVSASQVVDWVKRPIPIEEMHWDDNKNCRIKYDNTCNPTNCQLLNNDGYERYMMTCSTSCPSKYPWLENPLGN